MKKSTLLKIGSGISLVLCGLGVNAQTKGTDVKSVFNRMFDSISQVRSMSYRLHSEERIDNKFISGNYAIKYTNAPFNAYYKNQDNGVEILLKNTDTKALVNPNGFPYVDLHLDPRGKLMRQNQHQTLERLGFSYFGNILHQSIDNGIGSFQKNVHYIKDTVWEGKACYKMEVLFPDYTYTTYTVTQKGETITKIANKNLLSDYKIVSINKSYWYDDELPVGQKILIPNRYAKRAVLVIRKDDYLPVSIEVFDDKGLFEKYSFMNLQINVALPAADFAANNSEYHF